MCRGLSRTLAGQFIHRDADDADSSLCEGIGDLAVGEIPQARSAVRGEEFTHPHDAAFLGNDTELIARGFFWRVVAVNIGCAGVTRRY